MMLTDEEKARFRQWLLQEEKTAKALREVAGNLSPAIRMTIEQSQHKHAQACGYLAHYLDAFEDQTLG